MVGLPRPKLLLALVGVLSLLGGSIGLVSITWYDHQATLEDWRQDLAVSARLLESSLRGIHSDAEAHLLRIEDRLGASSVTKAKLSEQNRRWLDGIVAAVPRGMSACIHDSQGNLAASSEHRDLPACVFGLRERAAKALNHPGKTITSAILDERLQPDHLVVFSRTLHNGSGQVSGIAEILIDAAYFNDLFHSMQQPDLGSIFLVVGTDGVVVARHPMPPPPLYRFDTSKPPFTEFSMSLDGSYRSVSVVDGMERLISFRGLPDLDMVIAAGMTTTMVFRDWTARTQRNATLFAGAILLLLALAAVTNESLRHESRLLRSMEHKAVELTEALEEKDVLFQEVHHRVKNNLQVISSLLTMQLLHVKDKAARDTLKDALDRISSMGLVHQTLYENNMAANVDLGVYFGRLAEALVGGFSSRKGGVTVQVDVSGTMELERAVPLGMLANEALANALKHAFPDGRAGVVSISLARDDSEWHFSIRDDGIGLPERPEKGIGLSLIKALTRQLNGKSAVSRDGGTVVIVTFPV
ncbi:histidine kinase [Paramagnetospirillum kuznetsovii]|uniref:histidine kinase n=1 Tax=Paramagnetospirillum kuznetsovii TaxID=2053833 RepID=A0A364P1E7_9PROT|nr:histidine kinase dimerization/phosphoacceptor domain -containing protein [Paramagnetospirillum kuznetsovii]RAU23162.1 histidine kinase [Paramagnetospirillum kuznetsovii]